MTLWKAGEGIYSDKESKFAINFREDHPDLFVKLSNKMGLLIPGKTLSEGGYVYNVKEITSKKTGKNFVLVERRKDSATGDPIIDTLPSSEEKEAHKSVQNVNWDDRQARIDKAHQENLEVQRRQAVALENINETLGAILKLVYAKQEEEKEGV